MTPFAPAEEPSKYQLNINYTGEVWANVKGGEKRGAAYLDNLDVKLELDTKSLVGIENGTGFVHILYNNSGNFSGDFVGDHQVVSNIDSKHVIRLYELWYELRFDKGFGENQSIKFGLYDLNSEFDAIEAASLFINSSHGIGAEYAQSGLNGPSIFPTTSLALRYFHQLTQGVAFRVAVLDAVPGDVNDFQKNSISLTTDEGELIAAELDIILPAHAQSGDTDRGRFGFGTWYYTEPVPLLNANLADLSEANNRGFYGFYEYKTDIKQGRSFATWLRVGVAESSVNQFDAYFGTGVVLSGLLPEKFEDSIGFALALARNGEDYRFLTGPNTLSQELNLELTWRIRLAERMALQSDIQFIHRPGTDVNRENAIAIGVRLELALF